MSRTGDSVALLVALILRTLRKMYNGSCGAYVTGDTFEVHIMASFSSS